MQSAPSSNGSPVQVRELYQLVQSVRAEIMAELKTLDARWDQRLAAHEADHEKDSLRRSSMIRWAVTSIMTGFGVLVSLWYSMR